MRSREELIEHLERGGTVDYLFFWGHTPKSADAVAAIGGRCLHGHLSCAHRTETRPAADPFPPIRFPRITITLSARDPSSRRDAGCESFRDEESFRAARSERGAPLGR